MCDVFPFSQFYFGHAKQALELREHQTAHGPDATLGPYGPYRYWPSKTGADDVDQGVPRAPARETVDDKSRHVDPATGETLAPLWHEGSPRNQTGGPNTEVWNGENPSRN
jgi:hypothetical protein